MGYRGPSGVTQEQSDRFEREALARGVSQGRLTEFCNGDGRNSDGSCDTQRFWQLAPDTAQIGTSATYQGWDQLPSGQWRNTSTGEISRTYGGTARDNAAPVVTGQEELNIIASTLSDPWLADAVRAGRVDIRAAMDARNQSTPVLALGNVLERQTATQAEVARAILNNPGDRLRFTGIPDPAPALPLAAGGGQLMTAGLGGGGLSPVVIVAAAGIAYLLLKRRVL
ncbi:MAG: hypothetical protein ACRD15_17745 [Vicinamibacterales bacterium]